MGERLVVEVNHQFPFSAERVHASWLCPDLVRTWMRAALQTMGMPGELGVVEIDARIGGKFCFSDMRAMGEAFHWGSYKELEKPTRIAFTWNAGLKREESDDDASLVTIAIQPSHDGCNVKLTHSIDAKWSEYSERTRNGWNNMLVHIERYLTENPS